MPLPDSELADVWLRKNIAEVKGEQDGESGTQYEADEVYFRTSLSEEDVAESFDELFENGGTTIDEDTGEESVSNPTLAERVEALEEAFIEYVASKEGE
ncbi:MAG: hypothetical protein LUH18_03130 [Oscillospiraceae bacterium]|nr:hypothetical protein [Oscillospiraceae bacterium]